MGRLAALLALSLPLAVAARAASVASPAVTIDPPPGWSDITAQTSVKGVLVALRGPESSSFVVASIPEASLDSAASTKRYLTRALDAGTAGAVRDSGAAQSSDGQLTIALGGGLRSRAATADERRQGVVLVVQGAGSEVLFLKVEGDDASPKDQAAIVRATAADAAKVPPESVSAAARAPTKAGPSAVYAWAKTGGASGAVAAGFLPWQYWGYSVTARGPQAEELMIGALAALKQGPSAVPGLVEASPTIEIPEDGGLGVRREAVWGAGALILALIVWSLRRKKR